MKKIILSLAAALGLSVIVLADHNIPADIRVDGFIRSKWGQTTATGLRGDTNNCFNLYMPKLEMPKLEDYPDAGVMPYAGCVPVAVGQVMRYYEWPKAAVGERVFSCSFPKEWKVTENRCRTVGEAYDWKNMPLDTTIVPPTSNQRDNIGRLMYDLSVSCGAYFSPTGTYATITAARRRLLDYFNYASCECVVFDEKDFPVTVENLEKLFIPCLERRSPVILSVAEKGHPADHEVIIDGYGYDSDGKFLVHAICGAWGDNDWWFDPTEGFVIGGAEFVEIHECLFNIFPDKKGVIASGRVLDAAGFPAVGAKVTMKDTSGNVMSVRRADERGVFAFLALPGTYQIEAELGLTEKSRRTASYGKNVVLKANESKQLKDQMANGRYIDDDRYYEGKPVIGNLSGLDIVLPKVYVDVSPVADPVISPASGEITDDLRVKITCGTEGARIYYTLDGSMPSQTSFVYDGPIVISDTLVIRAFACKSGRDPSQVATASFTYANEHRRAGDEIEHPMMIAGASGSRVIESYAEFGPLEPSEAEPLIDDESQGYEFCSAWFKWVSPGTGRVVFNAKVIGEAVNGYINYGKDDYGKDDTEAGYWQPLYGTLLGVFRVQSDGTFRKVASVGRSSNAPLLLTAETEVDVKVDETYLVACKCVWTWKDYNNWFEKEKGWRLLDAAKKQHTFSKDAIHCDLMWSGELTERALMPEEIDTTYEDAQKIAPFEESDFFDWKNGAKGGEEEDDDKPDVPVVSGGQIPEKGATYNGFAYDADGSLAGTFTLVTKRAKNGLSAGTLTMVDSKTGKKVKKTGDVNAKTGYGTGALTGLVLNAESVGGTDDKDDKLDYCGTIDAAKAKDNVALGVLDSFNKNVYALALDGPNGSSANLTVTMAAKGKAKIAGTLNDGTKISGSTQMILVGDACAVPFVYSKKGRIVTFVIWMDKKETITDLDGLQKGWSLKKAGRADQLPKGSYTISMSPDDVKRCVKQVIEETPYEISADFNGKAFDAGKAASVKFAKSEKRPVVEKGPNISGIKLTVSKGAVKGSFTIYSFDGKKVTKNKFTVAGVVVGDECLCTASNKKLGSFDLNVKGIQIKGGR